MKNKILIGLLVVTIASIFFVGYYAKSHAPISNQSVEVTLPQPKVIKETKKYVTKNNEVITIINEYKEGSDKSMITISRSGNASTTDDTLTSSSSITLTPQIVTITKDLLSSAFLADIDKNGNDELYLITRSNKEGSPATITAFSTDNEMSLAPIFVNDITDESKKEGGTFEGYFGYDSIAITDDTLIRTFPVFEASSTNTNHQIGTTTLLYMLESGEDGYTLASEKIDLPDMSASSISSYVSIASTSWQWQYTTLPKGLKTTPQKKNTYILSFGIDNKVVSTTDCNTLTATYTIHGTSSLSISDLTSAKKYCDKSLEFSYLSKLPLINSYLLLDDTLRLTLSDGGGEMFFKKYDLK